MRRGALIGLAVVAVAAAIAALVVFLPEGDKQLPPLAGTSTTAGKTTTTKTKKTPAKAKATTTKAKAKTTTTKAKPTTAAKQPTKTTTTKQPTSTTSAKAPKKTKTTTPAADQGPQVQTIRVENGKPAGGVRKIALRKGDDVRIQVSSPNTSGEVRLRGYGLKRTLKAGGSVRFAFKAYSTGVFAIELVETGTRIGRLTIKA